MSEPSPSETAGQSALVVRAVLRTDVGLVRTENQDFAACTTPQEELVRSDRSRLLIVADGMGGHRGGATASRLATETVKARYLGSGATDVSEALRDSLKAANLRIFEEAQSNPELRGMGTTTSALVVSNGKGWIGHVGDSRVYLLRDGAIQQLTADHSLVATMMREGLLTAQEAETHPRRNVLQRSMGVASDVDVDVEGPIDLQAGDTLILCSDGLHGVVKEDEINALASGADIEGAADALLRRALERGAPDNVTVIVARVETGRGASEELVNPLDETQPLGDLIQKRGSGTQMGTAIEEVASVEDVGPIHDAGGESERLAAPPRSHGGTLKWLLLAVLVLGAAAGWLYWSGHGPPAVQSHSRSR